MADSREGVYIFEKSPSSYDKDFYLSQFAQYSEVDLLYNIARSGSNYRGKDLINPETQQRVYIADGSSLASEEAVIKRMGRNAVLRRVETHENSSVYEVPVGARLLSRTLATPAFVQVYMDRLQGEADLFLADLGKLDANRFGIAIEHLAIAHNGSPDNTDDVYLTIVPPLAPALIGSGSDQ